jgi:CubicO group peptidase (beta-lactamase class C family)
VPQHSRRPIHTSAALIALLATACSGQSLEPGVPPAEPGSQSGPGLAWWSRAAMDAYFRWSVWTGSRSGFIAMFARDGHPVHATAVGWADLEEQVPMALDTRLRLASMTKAVTAVAALILIEEGRLDLDDPVARWIPAFANARVATSVDAGPDGSFASVPADPIPTVRHLLMFASGVGPGMRDAGDLTKFWEEHGLYASEGGTLAERVDRVAALPLFEHPGERWRYGGSADVLARVVEVAAAEPFDAFLTRRIFEPLGMNSTAFLAPPDQRSDLARVYTQDDSGELILAPRETSPLDWTPGGGGLVSTAGDFLRFAMMLWNEGAYDGVRILSPETVEAMRQPHVPSGVLEAGGPDGSLAIDGLGWGLGVSVIVDADATPFSDRNGDFWWAGYFGTTFFVSPESGLAGVILSQNEPGPHSDLPIAIYGAQGLAFAGL